MMRVIVMSPKLSRALACCLLSLLVFSCVQAVQADRSVVSGGGRGAALEAENDTGVHDKIRLTPRVGTALVLACLCALMANAAGIGGGPIYLPLLMVVLGFELTPATALSHTIVATSAIASSMYGLVATSPNDLSRSLIDWDLTIFIPALLVGVSVGVLFNVLLPRWLQTILLTLLLLAVIYKTLTKAVKMWRSEQRNAELVQRLRREEALSRHQSDSDEGILHDEAYHLKPDRVTRSTSLRRDDVHRAAQQENGEADGNSQPLLAHAQEQAEKRSTKKAVRSCFGRQPLAKIACVVVVWMVFLVFQQLKSRNNRCSAPYLALFAVELVLFVGATASGIWYLASQAKRHPDDVDPELRQVLLRSPDDAAAGESPSWRLTKVAGVMTFAGLLAGLLGIGARALIFNPFLLALGVHPQVTASTSVLMILFTSSAIAISLGFHGYLNFSYAAAFAPLAFVSSILGVLVVGRLIKRTGHTSIIVFILAFLIVAGTVLTAVFGGMRSFEEWREGQPMGFKPICGHS